MVAAMAPSAEVRVLTFHPHPSEVLAPDRAPVRILDYGDQERFLIKYGARQVAGLQFTQAMAELSAREFFSHEILSLRPGTVVVGHDFRFGKARQAGATEMAEFCREAGIQFQALAPILESGKVISSTWVRDCLKSGDFNMATKLMGHCFTFSGIVVEGKKLGRTIGFPTANLELAPERKNKLPLAFGVYAGVCKAEGPFVMNVGQAPTISSDAKLKVELHFLNCNKDLYGRRLEVEPQSFIRPEIKFSSLEELKKQIQNDVVAAKYRLKI